MSYELTITTQSDVRKQIIKDLKEFQEILKQYQKETIEVELHRIKGDENEKVKNK